jgi:hypothetical protein
VIVAPVVSKKLNCHVVPLQVPVPAVNCGNIHVFGQSIFGVVTIADVVHPDPLDAVIVTEVFLATPVILFEPTVPTDETTPLVAFVKKLILYEVPSQAILPAVRDGFTQVGQDFDSTSMIVEFEQPDVVAVKVTLVPLGIFITLSPETVPALAETETLDDAFKKNTV